MSSQVFILADIGLGEHKTFHVGDEAMFYCNLKYYKDRGFTVMASSRSLSHNSKDFNELLDIKIASPILFLQFIAFAFVLRLFKINLFPKSFRSTVRSLYGSSLLHISGGGNLTSLWPGHIYYRCLMICIAWLHKIPVKITSQTIGPLHSRFHAFVLRVFLNKCESIGVRDMEMSLQVLQHIGVTSQKIHLMRDDAFSLKPIKTPEIGHENFNIGLSLHRWDGIDPIKLKMFLSKMYKEFSDVHFYLIPHMFSNNNDLDTEYMLEVTSDISSNYIHNVSPTTLLKEPDITKIPGIIKGITSEMDVMLSTRYHGLVFALSSEIPAIAINYDLYYRTKNDSAFNMAGKTINSLDYRSFSIVEGIELIKKIGDPYDKAS